MKIRVEIDNATVQRLIIGHIRATLPDVELRDEDVKIQVQSKQNYREREWETGLIRGLIEVDR